MSKALQAIIKSRQFFNLPQLAKLTYLALYACADSDGMVPNALDVAGLVSATEGTLQELEIANLIYVFEKSNSLTVAVRHWFCGKINVTKCPERSALSINESGEYVLNSASEKSKAILDIARTDPMAKHFNLDATCRKLYELYPRKEGKTEGMKKLVAYLTGGRSIVGQRKKYNHNQIDLAIKAYADDCEGKDKQYVKMFSSFMSDTLNDYIDKTKEQYSIAMQEKYGDGWESIRFIYDK